MIGHARRCSQQKPLSIVKKLAIMELPSINERFAKPVQFSISVFNLLLWIQSVNKTT